MERINTFLEEKILPYAGKLQGQKHFHAVFLGMSMAMPLIIIGSLSMVIGNLPIPNWTETLTKFGNVGGVLSKITNGSFGVMALVVAFGVAYNLAKEYGLPDVSVGIISLSAFIIITPSVLDGEGLSGIDYSKLGSGGLFSAIVLALVSVEIYRFIVKMDWTIKMPETVPSGVSAAFSSIIPGFAILFIWAFLDYFARQTGSQGLHDVVTTLIGIPLTRIGSGLGGTLVAIILSSVFWFLGIHGTDLIGAVMYPIWFSLMDANRLAFEAGKQIPNIISYPFMMNFVWLGGGGATLALAILLAFFSKSKQMKTMGKLSIVPSVFNINEPLMFGVPIVLNPVMLIPYIFVPVINLLVVYTLMNFNLVARPVGINPSWTMPIGLSGAIATNWNIGAILLQFMILALDLCLYYPFFKTMDKKQLADEQKLIAK
ncbi:hypothetical protein AOC36_03615 [Erysipelothrix larvae]|uniref:Permease IIC component n=1 Tax=Erysipelothrix larvae TaxID=1514105 RepID=A0A0X8GZ79_9FIRM|nr:PTS sugar transporter subunit IIC [Erysipelothrix larvae]AMC93095.1 hypothetical protein AOC36_03615 [Erysipelothrix larvae]